MSGSTFLQAAGWLADQLIGGHEAQGAESVGRRPVGRTLEDT